MSNDKPNLTNSHFGELIDNQFGDLLKPKRFYPTIMVEYSPTKEEWEEIAATIWVGALEGGSNHWIDYIHTGGNNLKSGYDVVEFNFDLVIHHGSDGWGEPDEEDETVEYMKAFDVIVDGINLLDAERQRMAFDDLGQLDANDYDYIIQLGVFGKEVYC